MVVAIAAAAAAAVDVMYLLGSIERHEGIKRVKVEVKVKEV